MRGPAAGSVAPAGCVSATRAGYRLASGTRRGDAEEAVAHLYPGRMAAVRIGVCSWADEGLLKHWYPRDVRTAEARLRHYAERFDTVEVDSPFYRLPSPETVGALGGAHARRLRLPREGLEGDDRPRGDGLAGARVRASSATALAPLEASGKLRGVLLQFHPRVKKTPEALDDLRGVGDLLDAARAADRVPPPLVDDRRGARATRSRSSSSTGSRTSPSTRREPARRTSCHASPPRRTTSRTSASTDATGRRGTRRRRPPASGSTGSTRREELEEWVEPIARLAEEAREVYAMFNNNRNDYAPRSAQVLRGLLDEAGDPGDGAVVEPSRRTLRSSDAAPFAGAWRRSCGRAVRRRRTRRRSRARRVVGSSTRRSAAARGGVRRGARLRRRT